MNMNEELEQIARDMRKKERELWAGNPPRMGNGAVALMLDGYASRLEVALGLAPRPKGKAAKELCKQNERAAGMRPWLAYAVAAAVVVALLALPGIIMGVAGWLTGGAR